MGCPTTLIVKNTFLCAVEDETASPTCRLSRRRSKTEGDYLSCLEPELVDPASDDIPAEAPTGSLVDLGLALQAGGSEALSALTDIRNSARSLAFDPAGSQLLQQALEVADARFAHDVASMLQGSIPQALCSQHAHQVLETLLPCLDIDGSACVVDELLGNSSHLATHAFGSSLVCRLLEQLAGEVAAVALIDDVLSGDLTQVICHKFGHRIALWILRNGLPRHKSRLVEVLSGELQRFARHRFASLVLALAFSQCTANEAHGLANALMGQAGAVASLACHSFGLRVVKALLELPSAAEQVRFYLLKSSRRLQKDKFGVRLLDELSVSNPLVNDFVGCVGGA
mmetsp:Transcript_137023/g.347144  ORF Transcript_137023/g.347144 Transcript_137023/m.347144 type:complete len:342 (-) Transcript_137023:265-1290(-)